jgi:hypothetical protein
MLGLKTESSFTPWNWSTSKACWPASPDGSEADAGYSGRFAYRTPDRKDGTQGAGTAAFARFHPEKVSAAGLI